MNATVCWLTDYYVEECKRRACIHSSKPLHLCTSDDEEDSDGSRARRL